ncbi:MAG TPA: biotin--[acetyl-CoA-carboxylase] ligase [Candidatus Hydrogenedentes bacterium]|nr:biotin--[acetyl-CoA-carboxylase] ligase [Candidatus Hydrogenedentota bacterium]
MPETATRPVLLATPLVTHIVGSRVLVYESIGSTSDCALRLGGEGTVIVADSQTAGRGRHGRTWHSEPGKGLWFSVAFEQPIEGLAFAAPLAVRDAIAPFARATIKWPNDVLLDGKKFCGVLIETRKGRTALGIGINVHHAETDFPEPLHGRATSIEAATGAQCDRGVLLRDVLTRLDERIMVIRSGGLAEVFREWSDACALAGRRMRAGGLTGVVHAIDTDGALIMETSEGLRRVLFGEPIELEGA